MNALPPIRPSDLAWKWPVTGQNEGVTRPTVSRVLLQALAPAIMSGFFFFRSARVIGWIFLALGGWMLFSGLLIPRAFLSGERFLKAFGRVIVLGLTWVLLVLFYFLCIFPLSLILRRRMRALLGLEIDKSRPTYWEDRAPVTELEHFRRQY